MASNGQKWAKFITSRGKHLGGDWKGVWEVEYGTLCKGWPAANTVQKTCKLKAVVEFA